jgi:hypothetical protein
VLHDLSWPALLTAQEQAMLCYLTTLSADPPHLPFFVCPAPCMQVLTDDIASAGFTRLLNAADDLVLDCPDAVHLLSLFLGR